MTACSVDLPANLPTGLSLGLGEKVIPTHDIGDVTCVGKATTRTAWALPTSFQHLREVYTDCVVE